MITGRGSGVPHMWVVGSRRSYLKRRAPYDRRSVVVDDRRLVVVEVMQR